MTKTEHQSQADERTGRRQASVQTRLRRTAIVAGITATVLVCGTACAYDGTAEAESLPTPSDSSAAWVNERMAQLTTEQKAAAMLMLHTPGTAPAPLRELVDIGISGLIFMGHNVPATPEELRSLTSAMQADLELPVLLGIDEEGGLVQRIPWDTAESAQTLRNEPPAAAENAFASRAAMLTDAGLSVNFGIIADVSDDPDSFIYERVLGTTPQASADRVAAAVVGEQREGTIASTLKHFPGHGAASGDSHSSLPVAPLTLDEWREGPAIPFAAGIDAGAKLVMTGHLAYPAVDAEPATFSHEWHRILREELGFEGVAVTDDMIMLQHSGIPEYTDPEENAVRAIAAGTDLLLYVLPADPSEVDISVDGLISAISRAVQSGRIPEARFDEAVHRVLTLRYSLL